MSRYYIGYVTRLAYDYRQNFDLFLLVHLGFVEEKFEMKDSWRSNMHIDI